MMEGNIRKMRTENGEEIQYFLPFYDVLEKKGELHLNPHIGSKIRLHFDGLIHCRVTGDRINKVYGEGMSYKAFSESPMAVESIIRPELSRIHEGIALRDAEWEKRNHLQPHVVYLSLTDQVKIGVTRETQIPTRWIDQGASQALVVARTPYRGAAGLVEVDLKQYFADKTNWRKMVTNQFDESIDLNSEKERALDNLAFDLHEWVSEEEEIMNLNFPVHQYPTKPKSIKLDKAPIFEKKLLGIKGQYLLFEDDLVMNVRSHSAYHVRVEV